MTEDIKNAINLLLTQVTSLNIKPLKNTGSFLNNEILRLFCHLKHIQCYHAALDSTESGIFKPDPSKIKRKTPKNVTISEKAIEKIKLRVIFNKTHCCLRSDCFHLFKRFNFNIFVSEFDVDKFLSDPRVLPCSCN